MKITYTKEEVLEIVLRHTLEAFPGVPLNHAAADGYGTVPGIVVDYATPPQTAAYTAVEVVNA